MQDIRPPSQQDPRILDISWNTIVKLSIAGILFYLLFLIKDILIWVLFGIVISLLFNPAIAFLGRYRVPRVVGTLATYFFVFGIITLSLYGTAPIFITEIQRLSDFFPQYFEALAPSLQGLGIVAFSDPQTFFNAIVGSVEKLSASFFAALFAIFGGIFSTVFVISLAIFLSLEEKAMEKAISIFLPKSYEAIALDIWARSQKKVSGWFLSRIVSSIFVAGLTYVVLILFNVQYPLSLALVSGVFNFIPIVGPLFIGAGIVLLVAVESWAKALFIGLAFFLIQQIEGSVLTPLLTKRFIGLSPALVLISLAIGGQLWGVMGAILAIPIAGICFEFLKDFLKKRKEGGSAVL